LTRPNPNKDYNLNRMLNSMSPETPAEKSFTLASNFFGKSRGWCWIAQEKIANA
jgi:hypothetical protein